MEGYNLKIVEWCVEIYRNVDGSIVRHVGEQVMAGDWRIEDDDGGGENEEEAVWWRLDGDNETAARREQENCCQADWWEQQNMTNLETTAES